MIACLNGATSTAGAAEVSLQLRAVDRLSQGQRKSSLANAIRPDKQIGLMQSAVEEGLAQRF